MLAGRQNRTTRYVMNDLDHIKEKIEELVPKAYTVSLGEHYLADKLYRMIDKSKEVAKSTINHIENGDLKDQKENSIIWHDLNAGLHYITLLKNATKASKDQEILGQYCDLIERLKAMRPPKD